MSRQRAEPEFGDEQRLRPARGRRRRELSGSEGRDTHGRNTLKRCPPYARSATLGPGGQTDRRRVGFTDERRFEAGYGPHGEGPFHGSMKEQIMNRVKRRIAVWGGRQWRTTCELGTNQIAAAETSL